ncbi:hypothetical protein CHS0354_035312 [Potamilus streckersoni]|uniref:Uncharacterized protein n=1 Tax=Potamilus streckersoni TaxID=2493646 RepID=A0AAE0S2R7_9BIVA|nr:hypothetical protein CHS0354_035312 [Potamilus streckersoni]
MTPLPQSLPVKIKTVIGTVINAGETLKQTEIDARADKEMQLINNTKIKLNGETFPVEGMLVFPDGEEIGVIISFNNNSHIYSKIPQAQFKKSKSFRAEAGYMIGNIFDDAMHPNRYLQTGILILPIREILKMSLKGRLPVNLSLKKIKTKRMILQADINNAVAGAGTSTLTVKGTEAHINGLLGMRGYVQIRELIKKHPEVKTVVLGRVDGSINDAANMHTGRILRQAGLNTKVLSDSLIASGGVDLFTAGKERIVEKGAKIGVHSWCCVSDLTAGELPKDHPGHQFQLEYFTMTLGPTDGPAFYFYTLEAAPFDDVHWMSDAEIKKWKVSTQFIEK